MSATMGRRAAASGLNAAYRWLAAAVAALVILQAILAGQWLAGHAAIIATHGWIGNLSFLCALILAAIGVFGWRRGWGASAAIFPVLVVVMMVAQLGLGYVGRKQSWAAGLHLTGGVLITALLVWIIALAWLRPAPEND